jgi:hypothetical protein
MFNAGCIRYLFYCEQPTYDSRSTRHSLFVCTLTKCWRCHIERSCTVTAPVLHKVRMYEVWAVHTHVMRPSTRAEFAISFANEILMFSWVIWSWLINWRFKQVHETKTWRSHRISRRSAQNVYFSYKSLFNIQWILFKFTKWDTWQWLFLCDT